MIKKVIPDISYKSCNLALTETSNSDQYRHFVSRWLRLAQCHYALLEK